MVCEYMLWDLTAYQTTQAHVAVIERVAYSESCSSWYLPLPVFPLHHREALAEARM